jgi:hypothetical protein
MIERFAAAVGAYESAFLDLSHRSSCKSLCMMPVSLLIATFAQAPSIKYEANLRIGTQAS